MWPNLTDMLRHLSLTRFDTKIKSKEKFICFVLLLFWVLKETNIAQMLNAYLEPLETDNSGKWILLLRRQFKISVFQA